MLKPLDEIYEPDSRHEYFVRITPNAGHPVLITLEEYHSKIADIKLTGASPEVVINQFDVSRNLFLYSWFVYEFTTPAAMQAFASVELALRVRLWDKDHRKYRPQKLRQLLQIAVDRHWIQDSGFPHLHEIEQWRKSINWEAIGTSPNSGPSSNDLQAYSRQLPDSLAALRNSLAHGSPFLDTPGGALFTLSITGAIINQVF